MLAGFRGAIGTLAMELEAALRFQESMLPVRNERPTMSTKYNIKATGNVGNINIAGTQNDVEVSVVVQAG